MVTGSDKNSANGLEALLKAAQGGDAAAYRAFLQAVSRYLRRFIARRIPAADVEDVLQDILISLHKARHTYDGNRAALPWVSAIARYRLADYLRAHYADNRPQQVPVYELDDFFIDDVTESSELGEYVTGEVVRLPDRQQKILYLMHTEGYTAKEVGQKLGMKESAVKVAAHRAYQLIKARLKPHG